MKDKEEEKKDLTADELEEKLAGMGEEVNEGRPVKDDEEADDTPVEKEAVKEEDKKDDQQSDDKDQKPEDEKEPEKEPEKEIVPEPEKSEDQKKTDDAMAKMRIDLKEKEEAIVKYEAEKAQALKDAEESAKPPAADQPSPDSCFEYLIKGQLDEDRHLESAARDAITKDLSSADINKVIEKAEVGGFGEVSADILEQANNYLPRVIARENSETKAEQEKYANDQKTAQDFQNAYGKEVVEVKKDFADLLDPTKPEAQAFTEWTTKLIGKVENGQIVEPGILEGAELATFVAHPYTQAKMFRESFNPTVTAGSDSELNAAKAQIAELEKKLNLSDSLESSSSSHSTNSKKERNADTVLGELKEMSA